MEKKVLSFRVDERLYDEIQGFADKYDISLAKMATRFMELGISAYKNKRVPEDIMANLKLMNNEPVEVHKIPAGDIYNAATAITKKNTEDIVKTVLEENLKEYLDKYFKNAVGNSNKSVG